MNICSKKVLSASALRSLDNFATSADGFIETEISNQLFYFVADPDSTKKIHLNSFELESKDTSLNIRFNEDEYCEGFVSIGERKLFCGMEILEFRIMGTAGTKFRAHAYAY